MPNFRERLKKPIVLFAILLPAALVLEFIFLVGTFGISLPSGRGTAVSSYEIRESLPAVHFITRNKRFSIVDRQTALVLRESFTMDKQLGVEGAESTIVVEALDGTKVRWRFEQPGERGEPKDEAVYEVVKFGCCGSANTYTYFSLRDGRRVRSTHTQLNADELAALEQSLFK